MDWNERCGSGKDEEIKARGMFTAEGGTRKVKQKHVGRQKKKKKDTK